MPAPLTGGLAPWIELTGGYVVRITAIDPTTGATVAGVVVSGVSMQIDTADDTPAAEPVQLLPPVLEHV